MHSILNSISKQNYKFVFQARFGDAHPRISCINRRKTPILMFFSHLVSGHIKQAGVSNILLHKPVKQHSRCGAFRYEYI